jgi:hypothetical protein
MMLPHLAAAAALVVRVSSPHARAAPAAVTADTWNIGRNIGAFLALAKLKLDG